MSVANLPESIQRKLAKLTADFTSSLAERFQQIDAGMKVLMNGDADPEQLKDLHLHTHKLNGSSSTFGYNALSAAASKMEKLLASIIRTEDLPSASEKKELSELFLALHKEWERIEPEEPEEPEMLEPEPETDEDESGGEEIDMSSIKNLIYLCGEGLELPGELLQQLGFFGFTIENICSTDELDSLLREKPRRLVLIDTEYLNVTESAETTLAEIKSKYHPCCSYFFLSNQNDFDTRLNAVRAGGDAFFLHPVDVGRLIDKIDSITSKNSNDPYHILIVDDDPEQVSVHALILQKAGMITSVALDPRQVIKVLVEAKPEIILMDMYMPGCSGMELAAVIRQQEAFVSIPIVFLSVEKDLDKRLAAIRLGGDDFLTKPISEEHLIASITNRVERTRGMRYLMERDSLTGLLNHSNLKENLNRELKRSERTESEICFAMIDIDHFKTVNDTYGHLTGDRVLQGLARLLQERLRSTDIIGRYGGEEFGVILLNISLINAKKIMDEVRENFSHIKQQSDSEEFCVTFSCGIACFPDFTDAVSLNDAADKALYEAKEGGRNRTILGTPELM
jgi:diguanylate cyclase (GGDEF)-like protein